MNITRSMTVSRIDDDQHLVWGIAATEAEASDGLIVSMDALKSAWDDYAVYANVREMHQPIAAGTVVDHAFDDEAHALKICAHVSDPTTWEKIKDGTLKAFSICGEILESIENTVTKFVLNEISLVDRPADPGAVISLYRAHGRAGETAAESAHQEERDMANAKPALKRADLAAEMQAAEGTPEDATIDAIAVLSSKFNEIADLISQLEADESIHPDVVAEMHRAKSCIGRALNAHTKSMTGEDDDADDADDGDEDKAKIAADKAKAAARVNQIRADIKRAKADDNGLSEQIAKLNARFDALEKANAAVTRSYRTVQAPTEIARADNLGPLEGTPEFDRLPVAEKIHLANTRRLTGSNN